jgi:hypothetical protein
MTATNHALTGAVVALAVKKPELAIPLAFISHFVIDVIPHFEARDLPKKFANLFIYADVVISAVLAIFLAFIFSTKVSAWLIFICSVLAVSPDFMWAYRYFRIKDMDRVFAEPMSWVARFHLNIQLSESLQGIVIESAWFALMTLLLINLS